MWSVAALNALLAEPKTEPALDDEIAVLRATVICDELKMFSPDLDSRWRGALFSLHPDNPAASRHFCTSAREMLSAFLESVAPDGDVLAADPDCAKTPQGSSHGVPGSATASTVAVASIRHSNHSSKRIWTT